MYPFSGKLFTFIESGVSLQFLSTLKNENKAGWKSQSHDTNTLKTLIYML